MIEYDAVGTSAHYYSIMVNSDGVKKIATYTFKSNMLALGECRNPQNTFYDSDLFKKMIFDPEHYSSII